MKDKNLAAVLAFLGGSFGLHRFYLGQTGYGILYILLFWLSWFLGIIDAIRFLSMDQRAFDLKYNQDVFTYRNPGSQPTNSRQQRHAERERRRAERERNRRRPSNAPAFDRAFPKTPAPGTAEREAGVKYFKDFEYDRAILAFNRALELNPRDMASHWNIACAYSCEEDAEKAFHHLDRAVALGFKDTDRIRRHDALAYLRIQPEFRNFADNGFRLTADRSAEEEVTNAAPPTETNETARPAAGNGDLLDQLQRLANLREKGLLTEREFVAQKKRLLG